jgi:hypothetical protein
MRSLNPFRRRSRLERAIDAGLRPGGDLHRELGQLRSDRDLIARSKADGVAICDALDAVLSGAVSAGRDADSDLVSDLLRYFETVEAEAPAIKVLVDRGLPLLVQAVEDGLAGSQRLTASATLHMLDALASACDDEAVPLVLRAVRMPFAPSEWRWERVFKRFGGDHPDGPALFEELRTLLPPPGIDTSLLSAANRVKLDGDFAGPHPFDSDEGLDRIERWLGISEPDRIHHAVYGAVALAFLEHPRAAEVSRLAIAHPNIDVRMEAGWAAAKQRRPFGLALLANLACDVNHAATAIRYLDEIGRADAIPPEAADPGFRAKAEFAEWLAHPNELGRFPDELEIVDHRTLPWPQERKETSVWLIRYRCRSTFPIEPDDVGVGMAGTCLWSFLDDRDVHRPPEDVYAIHCCWELSRTDAYAEVDVPDGSTEYDQLLAQWKGPPLSDPRVTHVAELGDSLKYPRKLVAVAQASVDGSPGWVVLDGPDSTFYPADRMPVEEWPRHVLSIHVGRRLLGFPVAVVARVGPEPVTPIPPHKVVDVYGALLDDFEAGTTEQRKSILDGHRLARHFEAYVEALVATRGSPRGAAFADAYERILELLRRADDLSTNARFDDYNAPFENHFAAYVAFLRELGRADDVRRVVAFFAEHWKHNLGCGLLGTAAFQVGDFELAEPFLLRLREHMEEWSRCEEMSMLAEIWHAREKSEAARQLLIDCLRDLHQRFIKGTESNRPYLVPAYDHHRATFERLFPEQFERLNPRLPHRLSAVRA